MGVKEGRMRVKSRRRVRLTPRQSSCPGEGVVMWI